MSFGLVYGKVDLSGDVATCKDFFPTQSQRETVYYQMLSDRSVAWVGYIPTLTLREDEPTKEVPTHPGTYHETRVKRGK